MATPKTLINLLLFLGVISACPDGECRQLFFRADFTFGNRRLIKHVIEAVNVRDFDNCELRCYHQPNCVSINFNVIRDSGGFHKCELNNATHRGHDNELENKDAYIYKGAESACDKRRCKNNGTCLSGYTDKGYRCLCPPQWTSHDCDKDVNECENGQTHPCDRHAICKNTNGSYSCHCEQGFDGDGFNCTDVNECENGQTNPCDRHAICSNTNGSYSCQCKQGFVGDGFNCTAIIPHPSAWFPLNYTHETAEIEERTTPGNKRGEVYLSLGPDGRRGGSYFFRGAHANFITFSVSKLDIGFPITIVCWLYTYDNAKTKFLQYKGIHLSANHKELKLSSASNDQLLTGTLAEKGWTFVGVSYNETTSEVKLWIDGNVVNSTTLVADFYSSGSQLLKLGGNNFKGKMTQLMLFNLTLTREQMQGIKGRMKLPAMIFNSTIISNNSFYRAELASFLAPAVGQMESKWKLCHSALANGWEPTKFHRNCDNKEHTVTIIQRGTYIFGGYTDIPWESPSIGTYGETLNAFVFSLENSKALPPFKCLAKSEVYAIYKRLDRGPSFGKGPFFYISHRSIYDSMAQIRRPYKVPKEVDQNLEADILADTSGIFQCNNYEVFYLSSTSN